MPQAAPILSVGLGALGLLQANEQSRKQRSAQDQATSLQERALASSEAANKPIIEALYAMLNLAHNYDPGKETDIAVQRASDVTEHTMDRALRGLDARYRAGGGTPGLSSEFNVKAQGMTDRVTDPLREFVAQQRVNEFAKKLAAYQSVNGGNPGNLASNYFNAANMSANMSQMFQPNYSGSLSLLGNALQGFFNKPGAGGSGDLRAAAQSISNRPWNIGSLGSNDMNAYKNKFSLGDDSYMRFGN